MFSFYLLLVIVLVIKKLYKNNLRILTLLHTYITEQTYSFLWQCIKDIVLVGAWHFLSEEHRDSQRKKSLRIAFSYHFCPV